MKTVDIIARGDDKKERVRKGISIDQYEWICPDCGHYEKEYETKSIVKCRACNTEFETNPSEHAYGK